MTYVFINAIGVLAIVVAVILWRKFGSYEREIRALNDEVDKVERQARIHYRRHHPQATTMQMEALSKAAMGSNTP